MWFNYFSASKNIKFIIYKRGNALKLDFIFDLRIRRLQALAASVTRSPPHSQYLKGLRKSNQSIFITKLLLLRDLN